MARLALLASLLAGCHSRGPACYVLYGYMLVTEDTREADEAVSNRRFDEATAAFRQRDYARAARGFLAAADPILGSPTAPNGELMRKNRLLCYMNAELAFHYAGQWQEGRDALLSVAASDPDNAEDVRALAERLEADAPR